MFYPILIHSRHSEPPQGSFGGHDGFISQPLSKRFYVGIFVLTLASPLIAAESLPPHTRDLIAQNCLACHAGPQPQADVNLSIDSINWQSREATAFWERIYKVLSRNEMPPAAAPQPPAASRETVVHWLEAQLLRHSPVGGTVPRRLNREEYENTIRDLFDISDFHLPDAFPSDDSSHGFDNVGEGLILSPPLMAQFLELATHVADEILPPLAPPAVAQPKRYPIGVKGLAVSQGGLHSGDRFRLIGSRNMASFAGWPTRFEATQSGVYLIEVAAAGFFTSKMFYDPPDGPLLLEIYARPKVDQVYAPFGDIRKLAQFEVEPNSQIPQSFTAEIELYKGEMFGLRWPNGPIQSDLPSRELSISFLEDRVTRDRLFYAAMLQIKGGGRGITRGELYERTRALMDSGTLDLSDPRLDKLPEVWGGGLADAPRNWVQKHALEEAYRFGPALDIAGVEIEGPLRLVEDDKMRARKARTKRFPGARPAGADNRAYAKKILSRFLPQAFRRPVSEQQVETYVALAMQAPRLEDGLHLAVRRALVSPNFLYRGLRPGRLDDSDLASRLSYFLTSAPPDAQLAAARLSDPNILKRETLRLLDGPRIENFVRSFTGQWLGTRLLPDIMPDPRLLKFNNPHRDAMIEETELFFSEILAKNLALETFIDPDFSYRNERLNLIYGGNIRGNQMRRVPVERGGREGGILGLASVMMATANGVDTQPILRGVWLLENVFGATIPEPPANVPAIAPDTSGTTSMRAQLDAHRADPTCARCHNRIDPLGMVLENFDPVGRWRDNYPIYTQPPDGAETLKQEFYSSIGQGTTTGPRIDAVGLMPDGMRLNDVTDLKRYVLDNIDMFSRGLTEKLLVYATGRPPSFGDNRVIDQLVADIKANGNGFRDLVVALVQSESFQTK